MANVVKNLGIGVMRIYQDITKSKECLKKSGILCRQKMEK